MSTTLPNLKNLIDGDRRKYHMDYRWRNDRVVWIVIDNEDFIRDETYNTCKEAEDKRDELNAQN